MDRELDIVVFGATGFTGRLVAEYLSRAAERPRWAIAGRDPDKLAALGFDVPALVADAHDPDAMAAVARRTRVVCTTVGPFAKHGSALVAACAEAGTHYCDLTAEVAWMRRMIDAHHERARATGARIVHACGFDSIPSDVGTWALQQAFVARFGQPAATVTTLFGEARGGVSGGTVASGLEMAREAGVDRRSRALLGDPYALDPEPRGPRPPAPDVKSIGWNRALGVFTAPFAMAPYNTRIVRRSHALAGFPYGPEFRYAEMMSTPGSPKGLAEAVAITGALAALAGALKRPWLRERLAARAPKPGEGPSERTRARGRWKARLVGEAGGDRLIFELGDPAGDPGYASTAKMLGESALCLALDPPLGGGGVLTPAVAMAPHLVTRLRRAGLTFAVAG